jgi:predicted MFS family arabinose efflux permease
VSWPPTSIFESAEGKHHGPKPTGLQLARIGARRSAWKVLRYREFRHYFAGSLISNFGTWFQNTAQVLLTYQLTHSVLAIGLVTSAQFSGSLLLGPFAAKVASRMGGMKMLIWTQMASAVIALGMAGLERAGLLNEELLILGALCLGLAFTFALPVQTALVPRLASEADTEAAMAMNSVSYNAGRALAPALSVLVIVTIGFRWAFFLNAISFGIFAVTLLTIHPPREKEPRPVAYARDGLVEALKRPRILLFLAMVAAVTLADDPILILGPAVAHNLPGASNDWAGYFLSALGLGTVLGSLRPTKNARRATPSYSTRRAASSLLLLAIAIGFFAVALNKWVSLSAAFVAGVAALRTGAVTQTQLVRQRPERTASVMALWAIAWAGAKPIASFLDGYIASTVGIWCAVGVLTSAAIILALSEIFLSEKMKRSIKARARTAGNRLGIRIEAPTPPYSGGPSLPDDRSRIALTSAIPGSG